ncbi:MAG: Mur ligase family protein [Candidatus Dormibacteria bacterium]
MSSPAKARSRSPLPGGEPGPLRLPPLLEGLRDQRVDVVGLASIEGGEMARYLLAAGFTQVVGHDRQGDMEQLRRAHHLAHAGIGAAERGARLEQLLGGLASLHLGEDYLRGIEDSAVVIPTQAWFMQPANQRLHQLREQGRPFYSLIQAYLDLARGQVIGITGSHGKSTTSALVAAALSRSLLFETVWLAGNDRHNHQALEAVARDQEGTGCLVLEISNRQLLQMDRAPTVAAITNITPNHLEEHSGMAGYVACKRQIVDLPGCRVAVRNGDDPVSLATGPLREGIPEFRFAATESGLGNLDGSFEENGAVWLTRHGRRERVLAVDRLRLPGSHNLANVRAAVAICAALDQFRWEALPLVAEGLESFGTLPHRIQLIWQEAGVDFYDDLSSTTPQSTLAALRSIGRACVLICGGQDKGIEFDQLAAEVGRSVSAVVLLPGSGSDRLLEAIAARGGMAALRRTGDLEEAVGIAKEAARPGDAILLSPACPGFFSAHYQEGGFRQAVRRLSTSPRRRREPG